VNLTGLVAFTQKIKNCIVFACLRLKISLIIKSINISSVSVLVQIPFRWGTHRVPHLNRGLCVMCVTKIDLKMVFACSAQNSLSSVIRKRTSHISSSMNWLREASKIKNRLNLGHCPKLPDLPPSP
jgi:hypothetical protein